jgi:hypothetical protein
MLRNGRLGAELMNNPIGETGAIWDKFSKKFSRWIFKYKIKWIVMYPRVLH